MSTILTTKTRTKTVAIVAIAILAIAGATYAVLARRRPAPVLGPKVGYLIHHFSYDAEHLGSEKEMTLAVWYPSTSKPKPYNYNSPLKPVGMVALNGEPDRSKCPYPLVVFSHGFMGGGVQSVFFTQYLAKTGYVVVSTDHEDAVAYKIEGGKGEMPDLQDIMNILEDPFSQYAGRAEDIQAVISEVLDLNSDGSSVLAGMVDEDKILMSGHSLGGWTGHVNAGVAPEEFQKYRDERIQATLFFDSYLADLEPSYYESKLDIPTIYQVAQSNPRITLDERRAGFDHSGPPKYLVGIKDATHLDFADISVCKGYATIEGCQSKSIKARTILEYAKNFVDAYLKGNQEALKTLNDPANTTGTFLKEYEQ